MLTDRTNRLLRKSNPLGVKIPNHTDFQPANRSSPGLRQALESPWAGDSQTTLPADVLKTIPQDLLANRAQGDAGKPLKNQSRPHAQSNQLPSGILSKKQEISNYTSPKQR